MLNRRRGRHNVVESAPVVAWWYWGLCWQIKDTPSYQRSNESDQIVENLPCFSSGDGSLGHHC